MWFKYSLIGRGLTLASFSLSLYCRLSEVALVVVLTKRLVLCNCIIINPGCVCIFYWIQIPVQWTVNEHSIHVHCKSSAVSWHFLWILFMFLLYEESSVSVTVAVYLPRWGIFIDRGCLELLTCHHSYHSLSFTTVEICGNLTCIHS